MTEQISTQVGGNEKVDYQEQVRVDKAPGGYKRREHVVENLGEERRQRLNRITSFILYITGAIEVAIGFRVLFKLIAANPANPFASFVYNITQLFVAPFLGLTVTPAANGMVLEISSIIAMIVYWVVGWGITRLAWLLFYRRSTRKITTYESE